MIVYELRCQAGHHFEAWFRNSDAFDQQRDAHRVACPDCGSNEISKAPMAPRIGKSGGKDTAEVSAEAGKPEPEQIKLMMSQIAELNRRVAESCDYVGSAFPEEARKIHYGETEHRDIYGEATREEAVALHEEGVTIAAIPWIRRTDS